MAELAKVFLFCFEFSKSITVGITGASTFSYPHVPMPLALSLVSSVYLSSPRGFPVPGTLYSDFLTFFHLLSMIITINFWKKNDILCLVLCWTHCVYILHFILTMHQFFCAKTWKGRRLENLVHTHNQETQLPRLEPSNTSCWSLSFIIKLCCLRALNFMGCPQGLCSPAEFGVCFITGVLPCHVGEGTHS